LAWAVNKTAVDVLQKSHKRWQKNIVDVSIVNAEEWKTGY